MSGGVVPHARRGIRARCFSKTVCFPLSHVIFEFFRLPLAFYIFSVLLHPYMSRRVFENAKFTMRIAFGPLHRPKKSIPDAITTRGVVCDMSMVRTLRQKLLERRRTANKRVPFSSALNSLPLLAADCLVFQMRAVDSLVVSLFLRGLSLPLLFVPLPSRFVPWKLALVELCEPMFSSQLPRAYGDQKQTEVTDRYWRQRRTVRFRPASSSGTRWSSLTAPTPFGSGSLVCLSMPYGRGNCVENCVFAGATSNTLSLCPSSRLPPPPTSTTHPAMFSPVRGGTVLQRDMATAGRSLWCLRCVHRTRKGCDRAFLSLVCVLWKVHLVHAWV